MLIETYIKNIIHEYIQSDNNFINIDLFKDYDKKLFIDNNLFLIYKKKEKENIVSTICLYITNNSLFDKIPTIAISQVKMLKTKTNKYIPAYNDITKNMKKKFNSVKELAFYLQNILGKTEYSTFLVKIMFKYTNFNFKDFILQED